MNDKAHDLGLTGTKFVEFTGLDENNVSTAADVARILRTARASISSTRSRRPRATNSRTAATRTTSTTRTGCSRAATRSRGKTGFINEAGYCFATWLRVDGRDLIAVVLGAPTSATRFADVVRLVNKTVAAGFEPQPKS
jgi:D-alanyl-D-alanine endopeptidase (penicillin-binding protein 7)